MSYFPNQATLYTNRVGGKRMSALHETYKKNEKVDRALRLNRPSHLDFYCLTKE